MQRSGPLKRKTPLVSSARLKRLTPLERKTELRWRPKADDRSADEKWATAVRKRDGYCCQMCGRYDRSIDAHHIATRKQRPDLVHVVSNGISLCRPHHRWVHDHPKDARSMGLLSGERYELNRDKGAGQ